MCPDIRGNNFEVLHSNITLDKVDMVFSETVKDKPTEDYSGFITYSNTIYISGIQLDNCGYLINQGQNFVNNRLSQGSKIEDNKKIPQEW